VITPNIDEAELLLGHTIADDEEAEAALVELLALGAKAVLLKGGHLNGKKVIDRLDTGKQLHEFVHKRLKVSGHGTGCTLASAIAANLALKKSLPDSCEAAGDYVHKALKGAYHAGKSKLSILKHI
jgi:hydroxymethylpyrimidine/phosphomethylpyrimidine kinase